MTVNQVMCPDCGRPPGIGRDTCAACGAILDPALRAAAAGERAAAAGRASLLADLPFAVPSDASGRIVAIAAWLAAIGFLLPWSNLMIGAGGVGGYLNTWGLATITHLPVLVALLALGLIVILPGRPVPWIVGGVAPLILGGLLVGLAWPYLVGGLGSGIGLFIETGAAVALIVGGSLRVKPARHVDPARHDAEVTGVR